VTADAAPLLTIVLPASGDGEVRESPDTAVLLPAARAGDREAFGRLVLLHERVVFRTALAALGSPDDAQDVAQEAFILAWRKLPGFRGEATFRTWLLAIVWRKALDQRRRQRLWWSRKATANPAEADPIDQLATADIGPERATVSAVLLRRTREEILRLSPKLRDTLLLASTGDHTYEEIARLLAIPLGTVKWRVAEARRQLSERLWS
jgi:RNA polymerase sigma-70 factor (ECF subfamily)